MEYGFLPRSRRVGGCSAEGSASRRSGVTYNFFTCTSPVFVRDGARFVAGFLDSLVQRWHMRFARVVSHRHPRIRNVRLNFTDAVDLAQDGGNFLANLSGIGALGRDDGGLFLHWGEDVRIGRISSHNFGISSRFMRRTEVRKVTESRLIFSMPPLRRQRRELRARYSKAASQARDYPFHARLFA